MENYRKASVVEQPCPCPFTQLPEGTPVVRVRDGSKIRNLMKFALSRMEPGAERIPEGSERREAASPARQLVFTGVGPGVSKAVTCVEILKRRVSDLHQCTRLAYSTLQENWEPLEPTAGLDPITVSKNVPSIWVLLSRDALDPDTPGYQAPGSFHALWAQAAKQENQKRKSGGRGAAGGRGKGARRLKTAGHSGGAH